MNNLFKTLLKSHINPFKLKSQQIRNLGTFRSAVLKNRKYPLSIEETKQRKLDKTEVRIKVSYCALNSDDVEHFRMVELDSPFSPGYEVSGKILEVGKSVTKEQVLVGEQVAALAFQNYGGFADECIVNVSDCFRIPENVTLKTAPIFLYGHTLAVYAFSKLRKLKENEMVLISAGTAGCGLAAIDVAAHMYKAKVIAVTDSEDRNEFVREEGAFQTITFDKSGIKDKVLALTKNKGADIIYDAVGHHMFHVLGDCVGRNGLIFHAAPINMQVIPVPPCNTLLALLSLKVLRYQDPELYRTLVDDTLQLANDGVFTPHIAGTFPLEKINDAIASVDESKQISKVLIEMNT